MLKRLAAASLLLAGVSRGMSAGVETPTAREFPVEPLTRYCLAFDAVVEGNAGAAWVLQVFDKEGVLPFEGDFRADWQRLVPQRTNYTHSFLTPRDGALVKLVLEPGPHPVRLTNVRLEPIATGNLVINGDFGAGPENYSGWNTRHLALLQSNEIGQLVLRCEPQGYALTDPIPVEPGATYRYLEGTTPGGRVLVYDHDLLRTGVLTGYHARNNPVLKMPPDAAYVRILYCDGREGLAPVIQRAGLERVGKGPAMDTPAFPPYPGEIVLDPGAALPEVRAAREIQHWVRRISGKEMRVLAASSSRDHTRIFVGRIWAEKLFPEDLNALEGSDGFAVRQKGKAIYIFGARPAGALFGAARFLEKNTDLIWAQPSKEFGAIFTPDPDLQFKAADFRLRSAFAQRMTGSYYAQPSEAGIWQGRAGFNTSAYFFNSFERAEMGGAPSFDDNMMGVIAQSERYRFEKCRQEHPEFFALVNGQREIKPKGYICYTAPGIAEAMAEGLCAVIKKAEARGDPLEFVSVRTRDGWTVCSCADCMKPIPLPDGRRLEPKGDTAHADPLFFSTRMVILMNKVAREFAKTYPDRTIGVPAYLYMSEPPAIPHAPSLVPLFCAYDTCSLRFPILDGTNNHITYGDSGGRAWEIKFREYLSRNAGANRKLSMFAYYYCNGFAAVADSAAADWSAMVQSGGVQGIHMDGFTDTKGDALSMWDHQATERWIMARLMWEPTLDPQELREYYIKKAYGKAAPEMQEFYGLVRKAWKDPGIQFGPNCHATSAELFENLIVKPGNEAKLRSLLVAAESKAGHPGSTMLVRRTLMAFDRFADSLKRLCVPYVPESTAEWNAADSTFWMQALQLGQFKRVSTWDDFKQAPARHPTDVAVMRDKETLYVRFQARDAGEDDRVELVLTAERRATQYYFALDRHGKRYEMKDFAPKEPAGWAGEVKNEQGRYTALFRIPVSLIREFGAAKGNTQLYAKFSRLSADDHDREESSLTGTSLTRTHYMNYWSALSIMSEELKMMKPMTVIPLLVLALLGSAIGKDLLTREELLETRSPTNLATSGLGVEPGKKIALSFLGRTDSQYTIEANARARLMRLGDLGSRVCVRFRDEQGKELRQAEIPIPVITREARDYVRVFYPPSTARSLTVALLPGQAASMAISKVRISTDLDGKEAECVNTQPAFEHGDWNFYGYQAGYGGGFFTRPDGKTVWNSGFTGTTPAFPVKGDAFYDFRCRGKAGESKSFIYLQCFETEGGKPFKTMKYGVSEKDETTTFKMPAGAVAAQLTCYYIILEEFRVVESKRAK